MKIFAVGKGGAFFKLGEKFGDAQWYATDRVANEAKNFKKLDEVEVLSETIGGKHFLTSIKSKNGSTPSTVSGGPTAYVEKPAFKPYERAPETQELIRRQAVGNMASRAVIALQGQVDPNNICDVIDTLYKKFDVLTKQ